MSRKDRRMSFCHDANDEPVSNFRKQGALMGESGRRKLAGAWSFRLGKDSKSYSQVDFVRGLKSKVVNALGLVSKRRSSGKLSPPNLTRCSSISDPVDSHRAEALEDCIEFLNYSASLKRTNSVSSNYS